MHQLANTMLNEKKQKPGSSDAAAKSYDSFYKSKNSSGEELHVILALERYYFWFLSYLLYNYSISMSENL
jgi:hypothetical protein